MPIRTVLLGLLACAAAVNLAAAQGGAKVENPLYTRWAKFAPGTTARIETVTETPTQRIEQTTLYKLVEKSETQLVVDMTVEIRQNGRKDAGPAQSFTHQRWFTLPPGMKAESLTRPGNILEEGKERLTVAGREYDAVWRKSKVRVEAGETFSTAWFSDAAPGGLIQEMNETPATKSKTTRKLVEVIEPKDAASTPPSEKAKR